MLGHKSLTTTQIYLADADLTDKCDKSINPKGSSVGSIQFCVNSRNAYGIASEGIVLEGENSAGTGQGDAHDPILIVPGIICGSPRDRLAHGVSIVIISEARVRIRHHLGVDEAVNMAADPPDTVIDEGFTETVIERVLG